MLSIHINSLNFKKASQDCTLYIAISNPSQNTAVSETVEYSKKDNIALFSEILYLKDITKQQQNKDEYSYLIIEVYEKHPNNRIIAQKTFSTIDIFSKKEVSLKTSDGNNEVLLHLVVNKERNIQQRDMRYQKSSSIDNCPDDSISCFDSIILGTPTNQKASNQSQSSNSKSIGQIDEKQNNEQQQVNGQSDQLFAGIFNSIKNGFMQLCEKEPEKGLDYMDMNQYMYQFVSKLGPVVAISNYLREVFIWTNITQSLMFGISMSAVIYYPQFIVLMSLIYTYFFTNRVIQIMFKLGIVKQDNASVIDKNMKQIKNLRRNMIFLQGQMRFYSQIYDQLSEFLFSDDKTQVILNIQKFRNYSIFLVVGMIFIPFQFIMFSTLWFALISQTAYGKIISKEGLSLCDKLAHQTNKFIENEIIVKYFPKFVATSLQIPEKKFGLQKVVKKFLIQENQRWWIGKGWVDLLIPGGTLIHHLFICYLVILTYKIIEIPKWSDLQGKKELKKEDFKLPDLNWQWENKGEWMIEKQDKTDDEGWYYGKAFSDQVFINEQKSLYYIRKRIWYKTCSTFNSFYEDNDADNDYQIVQN